ncbi:4Fe-4S dicluster domain-containing protein [Selenihalanaerobacter shriftii]|uniref:2-oxoglutarate ferredoxin oxidoreductase subunit delta n=1 Tax=Selenihalanaerobacter shriftii TaxID=142842 RepID=A0A1T4P0M2_9FIRM|nr:4Fe-4S dicluster domain-containing protein [Selenihalanaerobacter shriftii]SJZ85104.1 2-oxoglutarate ferredoxin oxidoreductase subunit delta [Selenihalanaerobacter shriftii]
MAKVEFDQDRCKGCELCTTVCPVDIVVIDDKINVKGFHAATVSDEDKCISCGRCASICPDVVIEVNKEE